MQKELAIVVPCYNEADRLPFSQFENFLSLQSKVSVFFVNDGSKDKTEKVLTELKNQFPNQIEVFSITQNGGKANAVFRGCPTGSEHKKFRKVAYLDADLATSLEECHRLSEVVKGKVVLAFGSRILKLDNQIKRKWYRFLLGRIVATAISKTLKLSVYDSQCGCKIFEFQTAKKYSMNPLFPNGFLMLKFF